MSDHTHDHSHHDHSGHDHAGHNHGFGGHHDHSDAVFQGMSSAYRKALVAVIVINAVMFGVEIAAGSLAGSQALKADALDFLADSLTYGLSLLALGWSIQRRAEVAIFKGVSLALMGVWVLGSTLWQWFGTDVPEARIMGWVGLMALAANVASVIILMRFKDGDANVRSVWLCSRNDAIGNVAVMLAAFGVVLTQSAWPDLIVATLMATLFLISARSILSQALRERRTGIAG